MSEKMIEVFEKTYQAGMAEHHGTEPDAARRAAVLAVLAAVFAQASWKPIETAPKDGSHILAYRLPVGIRTTNNTNPPTVVHWFDDPEQPGFYTSVNERAPEYPFNPTHWMPLPAAPSVPSTMRGTAPAGMECCGKPSHVGDPTDGYTPECCERYVPLPSLPARGVDAAVIEEAARYLDDLEAEMLPGNADAPSQIAEKLRRAALRSPAPHAEVREALEISHEVLIALQAIACQVNAHDVASAEDRAKAMADRAYKADPKIRKVIRILTALAPHSLERGEVMDPANEHRLVGAQVTRPDRAGTKK